MRLVYIILKVGFICSFISPLQLLGQHTQVKNEYIKNNFSQLGHRISRQQVLLKELQNLKGDVKVLTQDAYHSDGVYIDHQVEPGKSYTYVFDDQKKIKEYWMHENHKQPVIKEIYDDFSAQKLKYYMKFSGPGDLELSTTFLYNNRKICIGTKTSEGEDLRKANYDFIKVGDTSVVVSSVGHELYLSGKLIERASNRFVNTELFSYHTNGLIKEWKYFEHEVLKEVQEFDSIGFLVESQSFESGTNILDKKNHLIIYSYNDLGLLVKAKHRISDKGLRNFTFEYSYSADGLLEQKTTNQGDGVRQDLFYKYDRNDNLVAISNSSGVDLLSVEYRRFDDRGNWITKVVKERSQSMRFERYIEYRTD